MGQYHLPNNMEVGLVRKEWLISAINIIKVGVYIYKVYT